MVKIITLFQRNYETDHLVRNEVVAGAEWVLAGEGSPTRKFDGQCCMVRDNLFYRRYDAKHGKTPPEGFIPAQSAPDANSGHWPGWLLVGDGPEDQWFRDGWENTLAILDGIPIGNPDGSECTYELCGPRINGNPEGEPNHVLIRHGCAGLPPIDVPRDFEGLREYFKVADVEGIVWHHPDGRMVKLKAKDMGIKRGGPK